MIIHDDDGVNDDDDDGDDDTLSYRNDFQPQPFRLSEEPFNDSCKYKMV